MSSGGEQKYHQNGNYQQNAGNQHHLGPLLDFSASAAEQQNHLNQQNQWFSPFMGPSGPGNMLTGSNNYIESFTPLLSPANTPQVSLHQLSLSTAAAAANNAFNNLSPLNSPALMPTLTYTDHQFQSMQHQQHQHQQQQQQQQQLNQNLYDFSLPASNSGFLPSSSTLQQSNNNSNNQQQKQAHPHPTPNSFHMSGHNNGDGSVTPLTLVPLTPSQLMQLHMTGMSVNLDSSSHHQQQQQNQQQQQQINTTSSSTSVSSNPSTSNTVSVANTPYNSTAAPSIAAVKKQSSGKKSHENSSNMNAPYPSRQLSSQPQPVRKVSHKEAEQKRRDNLKNCFQIVKAVLPVTGERAPSKVQILKQARSHILDLRHEVGHVESERNAFSNHISLLEQMLGDMGMEVPERPVLVFEPRELGELDMNLDVSPTGDNDQDDF